MSVLCQPAFAVQVFDARVTSHEQFARLVEGMGLTPERNKLRMSEVGDLLLGAGWADSLLATDQQVGEVAF